MTQPTEAEAHLIDKSDNYMIGDQQAAIAVASDLATCITRITAILEALEKHGLIADN